MNITEQYKADGRRYDNAATMYRRCGCSGVLLPRVSLGLWHNFGGVDPFERSRDMMRCAFDRGVTPYGSAEETFGRLMQSDFRPYRDEMFISTKAGYDMWPGPYGNWGSRKYLMASLDQSLKRMNLDYVDLFYSHRYDPETPVEETLQALVDIVKAGKALYVGVSRWPLEALKFADKYLRDRDVPLLIYQGRLNLLDREPQADGVLDYCAGHGIGFISFSPLAQGLLTDKYLNEIPSGSRMWRNGSLKSQVLTPALHDYLAGLNDMAADKGMSLAEMALSWVQAQKGVTSVIVGASSVEQLVRNLQSRGDISFDDIPEFVS